MCLDELSSLVRSRTKVNSSSRRIIRLVPVFILDEFSSREKMFVQVRPVFTLDE